VTHAEHAGGRDRRRLRRGDVQRRARAQARAEAASRVPALLVTAALVVGVVAAGVLADRRTSAEPDTSVAAADLAPVAPGAGARGSTWYCAGGTGSDGDAPHRVQVLNPGDEPLDVVVTVVPGAPRGEAVGAQPVVDRFEVRPGESRAVLLADVVDAPLLAAIVEVGPGEAVVEHAVVGESDFGVTPCASASSGAWHLAAGTTTRDASEQLLLFNPFPDDAVVDVTFTTPDGLRSPPAFSGLIVPGRRVVGVDVGAVVSRHPNVATSVVARTGHLVVDRIQHFDGSDGPAGLALTGGAPAPAEVWHFPDGAIAEGLSEVVTVYNPTDRQAEVDVEVALDPTSDPAAPLVAEPFELSIAPQQFAQVAIQDDGRVPLDRGHWITVRSQNGTPVVAERWVRAASSVPGPGLSATLGSPLVAGRWLAATGAGTGDTELLVLANPSTESIARVAVSSPTLAGAGALAGLGDIEVAPSGRVVLDLGEHLGDDALVLVVQSTLPIVAERVVLGSVSGRSQSMLVASATSASVASVDTGDGPVGPLPTVATTSSTSTTSTSTTTTSTTTTSTTTTVAPTAPPP
jgi:hypothetical protein